MTCLGNAQCGCGCCAGLRRETPSALENRAGLSNVIYRVGDYARFMDTMTARLSSSDYPALARLTARDEGDFSVALLDSTAMMLDVLTFYQERLLNESYLRTARQRRSVLELGGLVGYQLKPGVAAETWLAFALKPQAGQVTIPVGTQVQSVPGPGEKPQTFETVQELTARGDWSAMAVQTATSWLPQPGDTGMFLSGTSTQINPGDVLLIVGAERARQPSSKRWDARTVLSVAVDKANNRTFVSWNEGLGSPSGSVLPAQDDPKCYVFRQKAALFGYNAIDPNLLNTKDASGNVTPITNQLSNDGASPPHWWWSNFRLYNTIYLDNAYPRVTQGSWVILCAADTFSATRSLQGFINLYRAQAVAEIARSGFGLSAKVTTVSPDTTSHLGDYDLRQTLVLAQSEMAPVAPQPLLYPLYGASMAFQSRVEGLVPGQALAIVGKRQKLRVRAGVTQMRLVTAGGEVRTMAAYDVVTLVAPVAYRDAGTPVYLEPNGFGEVIALAAPSLSLVVKAEDRDGVQGTLTTGSVFAPAIDSNTLDFVGADKDDPEVQEVVIIGGASSAVTHDRDRTTVTLAANMRFCYDRSTVAVNANVAQGTHGASTTAILGAGSAATVNQRFKIKSSPVTYVSADTPSGGASTLQVRVNDLLWKQVPSLYDASSTDRYYTAPVNDDGSTTIVFGDGVEGARLPTGQNNVRATFRVGLGAAGNVVSGRLTNLLDRPYGVTGVINPDAATGGQDPESIEDARHNVPLVALTLDRAVSLLDYENFAQAFSGIAKARAEWIPAGTGKGIAITVAGVDGAAVDPGSATYRDLLKSLRDYGDPFVPIRLDPYVRATFVLGLAVKVADDADPKTVLPAVETSLRSTFSFGNRSFGQAVSTDEIDAVVQAVTGVDALEVRKLRRSQAGSFGFLIFRFGRPFRLVAQGNEILTLDAGPLDVGVLS
jgi:baseplate J-like protein